VLCGPSQSVDGGGVTHLTSRIPSSTNRYDVMSFCGYDGVWSQIPLTDFSTPTACENVPNFFWNWGVYPYGPAANVTASTAQTETFGWSDCVCGLEGRNAYQERIVWCAAAREPDFFVNTTHCAAPDKPAQTRGCPIEENLCP